MTQRALGWVMMLAAVAGVVGAGLWVSQGEAVVAAVLLVAGSGLFLVRAYLDGLVDVVSPLSRAGAVGLERGRAAASYRPDVQTVRAVALVALVVLAVIGLQLAPVVFFNSDGTAAAANSTLSYQAAESVDTGLPESSTESGDYIYIGGDADTTIHKINKSTFNTVNSISSFSSAGTDIDALDYGSDGYLYALVADEDAVYKIDPSDMSEVAAYTGIDNTYNPTDVEYQDGSVYASTYEELYKLDASDLSLQDSNATGPYSAYDIAADGDGNLYVGHDLTIRKYDTANGFSLSATHETDHVRFKRVELGPDGYLYGSGYEDATYNGTITKIDTGPMSQVNQDIINGGQLRSLHVGADGYIYTGSDNAIRRYDRSDLSILSKNNEPADIVETITGDSRINIYTGERDGTARKYSSSTVEGETTGETLSGTVTDSDGNPIPDATVEAINASTRSTEANATTDTNGTYEMTVDSGDYDVTASKSGLSPRTKSVTVAGDTTVNFTLTSDTSITDPDPPDRATVSEPPVQLSVLANTTNQSVQSIDVEFYEQTNGSIDPANDTQIGSTTVAPGERAAITWDPGNGTYEWYAIGTADSGATDTGGPYTLGIGEAEIIDGSEQPPDGAVVDAVGNVDLAVDVRVQDNATVGFYDFETGNPANDPLIGNQSVDSSTSTASTTWTSSNRSSSEEWYAVLEDSTGTRDTAGAFAFGPGGQVVARDAETGDVIDDRRVRFDTVYPGGSESFDRAPGILNLSRVNSEPGDSIRIDVKAQDYYVRTVEVSGKQANADVYLERGGNWSYNPSSDDPENTASVENDDSRFVSRFTLQDQTGRYPPSNTTLTVRADIDGDGQNELVHRSSFGAANRVDVQVEKGERYQLLVENDEGDSRGLGGWTATEPDTTTLTISRVTEEIEIDQGYGVDAEIDGGTLKIYYRDYETSAETLDLEVRQYPDGPYLENRTLTDVENATVTIALNESQAEKTWQIDYEGTRIGVETAAINGQVTTGASGRVPLPVGSDVLIAGALIILAIVGALFTGPLSAVGSVGMVGVAGVLYFIGWLPINAAALWVAAIVAVGSVLRSGGGRLG